MTCYIQSRFSFYRRCNTTNIHFQESVFPCTPVPVSHVQTVTANTYMRCEFRFGCYSYWCVGPHHINRSIHIYTLYKAPSPRHWETTPEASQTSSRDDLLRLLTIQVPMADQRWLKSGFSLPPLFSFNFKKTRTPERQSSLAISTYTRVDDLPPVSGSESPWTFLFQAKTSPLQKPKTQNQQ